MRIKFVLTFISLLIISTQSYSEDFDFSRLKCSEKEDIIVKVKALVHDELMTEASIKQMTLDGMEYGLSEVESEKQSRKYYRQAVEFNEDQKASLAVSFEECTSARE